MSIFSITQMNFSIQVHSGVVGYGYGTQGNLLIFVSRGENAWKEMRLEMRGEPLALGQLQVGCQHILQPHSWLHSFCNCVLAAEIQELALYD